MIHCGRLFQVIVKQGRCKCFGFMLIKAIFQAIRTFRNQNRQRVGGYFFGAKKKMREKSAILIY